MENLLKTLKFEEGFSGEPYNDSLGKPTIGYGTLLPLTQRESEVLLEIRLKKKIKDIKSKIPFWNSLSVIQQDGLVLMSYQLGVGGVLNFKKMLKAVKECNSNKIYVEAMDSRWAKQTPSRARRVAKMLSSTEC